MGDIKYYFAPQQNSKTRLDLAFKCTTTTKNAEDKTLWNWCKWCSLAPFAPVPPLNRPIKMCSSWGRV